MTAVTCYPHGGYPHSETLAAVARDAARGRCPASDLLRQRRADQAALEALQRKAGMTFVSSGMLGWQDLFRRLAAARPDWSTGPLRRWFAMASPPWLILSSSCELELLPRTAADRKIRALGQAVKLLDLERAC